MQKYFEKLTAGKSDEELRVYITDCGRYEPAAINAAIDEFKKRGVTITGLELDKINTVIEQKEAKENLWGFSDLWSANIVKDADAPEFYSQKLIYRFSYLFSVIAGAILLAINISKSGSKKGVMLVIFFGIFYSVGVFMILGLIPHNPNASITLLGMVLNGLGAVILNIFFWNKYIGKLVNYRRKPFWIPLVVCILVTIMILVIALIVYNAQNLQNA